MSITQPQISDAEARAQLLSHIEKESGPLTLGELVSQTGLEPARTEKLLERLVVEYESSIEVSEEGDLLYRFTPGLDARRDIVSADAARRRKAALKAALTTAFKVWTVAMVVVYTVIYVTLLVTVMVAASSQSKGRSRRSSGFGGSLFRYLVFRDLMHGWGRRSRRRRGRHHVYPGGYQVNGRVTFGHADKDEPTVLDKTWFYLFGTSSEVRTPLEREKEILTYIQAHNGLITNADIMGVMGVTYSEADAVGTRLAATYQGEIDIHGDGTVIYRFPLLLRTANPERAKERSALVDPLIDKQAAQLDYTWTLRERAQRLRDAGSGFIPWLNGFNLVLAGITYTTLMPILQLEGPVAVFWLVLFPGIYSLAFLGLGVRRSFTERRKVRDEQRANMRLSLCKHLFSERRAIKLPRDARTLSRAGLGKWTPEALTEALPELAQELRATVEVLDNGGMILRATSIVDELKTVEVLRRKSEASTPVGRTVFSSALGGVEELPAADQALLAAIDDATDLIH